MYELGAGILPNSICVPLTATARAQALYFYPVLCGHYYCDSQYQVSRPCYENPLLLFVRSAVENGDHYIRTLVGGSLSYYTVDLAWGWVAVLYLLLAYAALPVQGAVMKPAGKARGWCCAAAALCCLLAVAGCLLWTPTHYDTLYGLQGRYFLPVLPLLLLTCLPRRLAAVPDEDTAQTRLVAALALVQAGVVVNIMLAIIAR